MVETTFTSTASNAYSVAANWSAGVPTSTTQGHISGKLVQVPANTTLSAGIGISGNGTLELLGNLTYTGSSAIGSDAPNPGGFTLVVDSGATISDYASLGAYKTSGLVSLASGSTLDIGTSSGFGSMNATGGGVLYVNGSGTIQVSNVLSAIDAGSKLFLGVPVLPDANGAGFVTVGNSGTVEIGSAVDNSVTVNFTIYSFSTSPKGGLLMLDFPGSFNHSISGFFNNADTVDAGGSAFGATGAPTVSYTEVSNVATLTIVTPISTGTKSLALTFNDKAGRYAALPNTGGFTVTTSGTDYIVGTTLTACYAAGTRIRTAHGEIAVEALRVGDSAVSAFGGTRPIVWLGHREVDCLRHPKPESVWPVRVQAGAFAPGVPSRDLVLSPDHAVHADGNLVPIRYLLNGASIAQVPTDRVTYWHVELPAHDVLFAENLQAESYLDTGNRGAFAGQPITMAHPDFALRIWEAQSCAPLLTAGPDLAAIRARLLTRCEQLGHTTTTNPDLHLLIDGQRIDPTTIGDRLHFALPPGSQTAQLISASQLPAELSPDSADHRRLGIAIAALALDGIEIPLDDPRLATGWHAPESALRWTSGHAAIAIEGARTLTLKPALEARYWDRAA